MAYPFLSLDVTGYIREPSLKVHAILENINLKLLSKSFETSKRSCFYLAQFPILSVL